MRLLVTAIFIWFALSVPVALAMGRILGGAAGESPPGSPSIPRQPARKHLVRS